MYEPCELDERWRGYFDELDPQVRLKRFNALAEEEERDLGFCRKIYQERYTDPKHPDRRVDNWLWKFVYLPGLFRRRKFLKGALRKELEGTLRDLHLEHPEALSEAEQAVLYWEFRNAARRYLSTCRGSRYARRFLGLKAATDQDKRDRACKDIWSASRGLARAAGAEENLRLWCDALYAELLCSDPDSRACYERLEENFGK